MLCSLGQPFFYPPLSTGSTQEDSTDMTEILFTFSTS